MPTTLTYSGARIPLTTEADTVPADLLRFGTDIDQMLVLKAASTSDRDARFANVNAGTLVSCDALGTVWQKKAAGGWRVLAQTSDPVTSGIVAAASGWSVSGQFGQKVNGSTYIRIALVNNTGADIVGNDVTTSTPGNITDITIGTVSGDWLPPFAWPTAIVGTVTGGTGGLSTAGALQIATLYPSGRIRVGDTVTVAIDFPSV